MNSIRNYLRRYIRVWEVWELWGSLGGPLWIDFGDFRCLMRELDPSKSLQTVKAQTPHHQHLQLSSLWLNGPPQQATAGLLSR